MDFKNVPNKYRPIPFWSWNYKLDVNETKEQILEMNKVGMGGFFMHARGGLKTPYMGDEWFENVSASVETAENTGMSAWAYDENGWPSGFGDGKVNGLGIEYQQKYLRMEDENTHPDTYITKCGAHHFYYEVNPFYVDTLDKKVIAEFINVVYKTYYEKYGNKIEGFFTDEPQISRNGLPWSFVFEEEYNKRYNENILEHLEELFIMKGDYKATRIKFWSMETELFSDAYMKQIYDYCEENGLKLTGHLANETHFDVQIDANGACMPHYEYFHIPGIDWLGRAIDSPLLIHQLTSAAQQFGKKQVLTESFALCGHNVSFAELKGICEWQKVRGVNLLCQHLEGYSLKGMRKRDYPPAMYLQQPWWNEYKIFIDAMARVGMVLSEGETETDVLLLHPMSTAWTYHDSKHEDIIVKLNEEFVETIDLLEKKHISFHLGDETIIKKYGRVENGKFVVGKKKYSYVIKDNCEVLFETTEKLLNEFLKGGGKIVTANELPLNDVVDNETITYAKRRFDEFNVHYFVNTSAERKNAEFNVKGKKFNICTGDLEPFSGKHSFEAWGSIMIVEDRSLNAFNEETIDIVKLPDEALLKGGLLNTLTLDRCDYYFDGVLQEKDGYVLNICERANALEKEVKIHKDYHLKAEFKPKTMYLVCETPEFFEIKVNGNTVTYEAKEYFIDKSFKKIDIAKYIFPGDNIISFDCTFKQSDMFYESLRKAYVFESEKNKLAYDIEIEPVYILGEFSVKTDGEWFKLPKNASRYKGEFVIAEPKKKLSLKHIEKQGYPCFCGEMSLEGIVNIKGDNPVLEFDVKGFNVVKLKIGDREEIVLWDNRLPLKSFGIKGETKFKLTLVNNLRNLLGPHHLEEGETYKANPGSFYKEYCVWKRPAVKNSYYNHVWNDDYAFVEMSV